VSGLTTKQADELAGALELDLAGLDVCYACLSSVAFPLDLGRVEEAAREARRVAPELWDEGLAVPLQAALAEARQRGVPLAAEAEGEVTARGARARIVAAVVRRLAAQLVEQMRAPKLGGRNGHVTLLP
jgi:hypothetical protein